MTGGTTSAGPGGPADAGADRDGAVRRLAWRLVGRRLMALSFHNWYGVRVRILRAFGCRIDATARVRPSAIITHPWRVEIGPHTAVGDGAILAGPGAIVVGARCTVSQYAHLCTRDADEDDPDLRPVTRPITLGDDVWVATDVYVAPGVTIGPGSVVGARSTVREPVPGQSLCAGDKARIIGRRVFRAPTPAGGSA